MSEQPIIIPESEKGYRCEVILDSVNPVGVRLTTMRWKYPLAIHAEACRHRVFSRSVASNRAIPTPRIIALVEQDPFIPVHWGKNQAGMQAEEELTGDERMMAEHAWRAAIADAVNNCRRLHAAGVHKQIANRVLMPYQFVTEIVSATDWQNLFALRCHPAAQPEFRKIAEMARGAYRQSVPTPLREGEWHLPLIRPEDLVEVRRTPPGAVPPSPEAMLEILKRVSAARCARTSYRTHSGSVSTVEEDLKLYQRLVGSTPLHVSPCEHQAQALGTDERCRNFRGWRQARTLLEGDTVLDELWTLP